MRELHEASGTVADAMEANAYDDTMPGADEGGRIATAGAYARSLGFDDKGRPVSPAQRFRQGEWWRQKDGTWIRIADMAPSHRGNTARMLLRHAARHAFAVGITELNLYDDAPESVVDSFLEEDARRLENPAAWLRGTPLWAALTKGLTGGDARGLDAEPLPEVCQIPDCGCSGLAHP